MFEFCQIYTKGPDPDPEPEPEPDPELSWWIQTDWKLKIIKQTYNQSIMSKNTSQTSGFMRDMNAGIWVEVRVEVWSIHPPWTASQCGLLFNRVFVQLQTFQTWEYFEGVKISREFHKSQLTIRLDLRPDSTFDPTVRQHLLWKKQTPPGCRGCRRMVWDVDQSLTDDPDDHQSVKWNHEAGRVCEHS